MSASENKILTLFCVV